MDYALTVFYDVTQHSGVDMYQHFLRTCWPHLLFWRWSSMVHWKIGIYLPHFMVSDSRGQVINNDYCQSFTFIKKLVSKENEHTNLFLNKVKLYSVQTPNAQANALTFTKVWWRSSLAEDRCRGSCWRHRFKNWWPSSLRLSGTAGVSPIPTLNIIW